MADDAVASWLEENGHSGSFFFFKQKTAYEIIAGDWSSDVCSSDLIHGPIPHRGLLRTARTSPIGAIYILHRVSDRKSVV